MVACKYFQQGNCRFGQYCRYEHINNFGKENTWRRRKSFYFKVISDINIFDRFLAVNTNRNKNYDGKSVA